MLGEEPRQRDLDSGNAPRGGHVRYLGHDKPVLVSVEGGPEVVGLRPGGRGIPVPGQLPAGERAPRQYARFPGRRTSMRTSLQRTA